MFFQGDLGGQEKFKLNAYDLLEEGIRHKDETSPDYVFVCLTEQSIQIRSKPKDMPFVESTLKKTIQLDEIRNATVRKSLASKVYAIGFKNHSSEKVFLAMKFEKESECDEFFQLINTAIELNKKSRNKSEFNYFPIEQNLRKIVEVIILKSPQKAKVYQLLMRRLSQRKVQLNSNQNRLILMCLVNQEKQMEEALRKQKIEAYNIDKKQFIDELKEAEKMIKNSSKNEIDIEEPNWIEGYTKKRRFDGIVPIKGEQNEDEGEMQLGKKFQQSLCLGNIPHYSDIQIHEKLKYDEISVEQPVKQKIEEKLIQGTRIKIPHKDRTYGILGDRQLRVSQPKTDPEPRNEKVTIAIEAVKLLYQMMKKNSEETQRQKNDGPLKDVLDQLKNLLVQMERQFEREKERMGFKFFPQFIRQASKNFNDYKGKKFKFYQ